MKRLVWTNFKFRGFFFSFVFWRIFLKILKMLKTRCFCYSIEKKDYFKILLVLSKIKKNKFGGFSKRFSQNFFDEPFWFCIKVDKAWPIIWFPTFDTCLPVCTCWCVWFLCSVRNQAYVTYILSFKFIMQDRSCAWLAASVSILYPTSFCYSGHKFFCLALDLHV